MDGDTDQQALKRVKLAAHVCAALSELNAICTGETVQVFLDSNNDLMLTNPPFYEEWKRKVGLLK